MEKTNCVVPTTFSSTIMKRVIDADLHILLETVPYSTSIREVVTVNDMEEYYEFMKDKEDEEESQLTYADNAVFAEGDV